MLGLEMPVLLPVLALVVQNLHIAGCIQPLTCTAQ
jgi:hypothetical protein